MLIVADSKIPFLKGVFEPFAEVRCLPPDRIDADAVRDADALIIRTRTRCAAPLLDGSRVSMIATATIGTDHIDPAYCAAHGIEWTGAPGCNAASVAQYMTSALLRISLRHKLDLRGKTLGVVGCGNVGTKVAAAAAALGMNVLVNDPPRAEREGNTGFVPLERIQQDADFITLHVPLTHSGPHRTFRLADEDFFRKLRKQPFFFNTSRGDAADGNALKAAVITHLVSGAILDVWHDEPDIDDELLSLAELATPHIAGYSTDGKANGTSMAVRAVAKHFGIAPLLDFFPSEIPAPPTPVVTLDPASPHPLADAVFASYDVAADDAALRAAPGDFEALRGSYRVRREFPAYTVRSDKPLPSPLRDTLLKLGFRLG